MFGICNLPSRKAEIYTVYLSNIIALIVLACLADLS